MRPLAPPLFVPPRRADPLAEHVAAAAAGDHRALTVLTTALLPRVRNLVRYLIRGDADVDDVAQEALLAVFRGLPTYQGDGALTSWVDRVTARATFAWLARRRRTRAQVEPTALVDDASDAGPWPDEYLLRRELVRLLDQVPEEQRAALVLHHVVGLSVPEIAAETGVVVETVRTRLRLGRGRLRQLCQHEEGEASHACI